LLRRGVVALRGLYRDLVLAVSESHELDEASARFAVGPIRTDLLVTLEVIAAEPLEGGAKAAQKTGVLGARLPGNDITIGLQQHSASQKQVSPKVHCGTTFGSGK